MKAEHIGQLIGNTPLVRVLLPEIPDNVAIYGKLEGNNPAGSVKDRPAYNMIAQALKRGEIDKSTRLVEATSGNTGIALAMAASIFGLSMTLIMPDNATQERIDTMHAYGASLILTPADKGIEFSRELADRMVAEEGYYMLNQFANPDNYMAHYHSTGPEIWAQTEGRVTHFVSSMGTTGTIMGNSMYLKEQNPQVQIVGVQPEEGASIPGIRKWSEEYLPKIYDASRIDQLLYVSEAEAKAMANRMARLCGIFGGMSSGGAMAAAVRLAQSAPQNSLIVSIVCDRGDRYLSSGLFSK